MAWLSFLSSLIIAGLTVLAVSRITRALTKDTITAPLRTWVRNRATRHPRTRAAGRVVGRAAGRAATRPPGRHWVYLNKLLTCTWCAGFWVSAAMVLAYFRAWLGIWPHSLPTYLAYGVATLATSHLAGLLHDWLDSPPPVRVHTLTPAQLDVTIRRPQDH